MECSFSLGVFAQSVSPDCPQASMSQGSAEEGLLSIQTLSPRSGRLVSLPNTPKNLWWELWSPLSPSVSGWMVCTLEWRTALLIIAGAGVGYQWWSHMWLLQNCWIHRRLYRDPNSPFPGYLMAIFNFLTQGDYFILFCYLWMNPVVLIFKFRLNVRLKLHGNVIVSYEIIPLHKRCVLMVWK